ncbi:hypothetical protein R1sor_025491 [Riccia sorocarpa]|uniref:Uncharacterized protein n=1 Tax=Riccia sorocarpa TaxID=122646 RepID=A0ABD3G8S9_9MARC
MASRGQGAAGGRGNGRGTTWASALWWIQFPYASRWRRRLRRGSLPHHHGATDITFNTRTGEAGGRANRDRDDRGKRPMVVPDPICEPVEETLEEGELAPIIIGQPTAPSTQVEAGKGSSAGQKKKKKKKKTWFAENAKHRNTFKLYNTPGTSMGVRILVEHLCELGRQMYEGRREIAPALPPFDTAIKTRMELWAESVPYKLMDEYKIWIKTKVFKDWSNASY